MHIMNDTVYTLYTGKGDILNKILRPTAYRGMAAPTAPSLESATA